MICVPSKSFVGFKNTFDNVFLPTVLSNKSNLKKFWQGRKLMYTLHMNKSEILKLYSYFSL